jgi:hypothetical protein
MDTVMTKTPEEKSSVRGFYRVQIVNDDGTIDGDSGWQENQITNLGFNSFLVGSLGGGALASSQLGFVALGTGTIVGAAGTSLDGEVMGGTQRAAVTKATSTSSKTLRLTGTFASGFITGAGSNIANIGLFASSSLGTIFAGSTYASSACASNQAVNVTYDIVFT